MKSENPTNEIKSTLSGSAGPIDLRSHQVDRAVVERVAFGTEIDTGLLQKIQSFFSAVS